MTAKCEHGASEPHSTEAANPDADWCPGPAGEWIEQEFSRARARTETPKATRLIVAKPPVSHYRTTSDNVIR